jgi:hypothetical protein
MLRGLAALVALVLSVRIADADPDPLAQARAAVAESDYVAARPALAAALDGGGRGPEELAEIYRLTGIVTAALGDARAATDAFTRLLALSPKASLPAGTSPKIKRPFDAAAKYAASHPALELKIETRAEPPAITLVVVNDPLHLVARARVAFRVDGGAERSKDAAAAERTELALPAGRRIDAQVAALDAHGNRVFEIGSADVPIVIVGAAPPPAPVVVKPAPRRVVVAAGRVPVYRRWWPYAAVGVAFGGVAGYFGYAARSASDDLRAINADSTHHTFAEARSVEDRARRDVLVTNVALVGAGVFAVTAGVMYLLTPRDHVETRVSAVPLPGGGAVVLGGKF